MSRFIAACRSPGCRTLTRSKTGYCRAHKTPKMKPKPVKPQREGVRQATVSFLTTGTNTVARRDVSVPREPWV